MPHTPSITPPPMDPPHSAADCLRWQDLDAHFGTGPDSPLHHNNRCTAPEHAQRAVVHHPGMLRRRTIAPVTSLPTGLPYR